MHSKIFLLFKKKLPIESKNEGDKRVITGKSLTEIKYKIFEKTASSTIFVGKSSKTSKPSARMVSN